MASVTGFVKQEQGQFVVVYEKLIKTAYFFRLRCNLLK